MARTTQNGSEHDEAQPRGNKRNRDGHNNRMLATAGVALLVYSESSARRARSLSVCFMVVGGRACGVHVLV